MAGEKNHSSENRRGCARDCGADSDEKSAVAPAMTGAIHIEPAPSSSATDSIAGDGAA
jgi:hypothetical protein